MNLEITLPSKEAIPINEKLIRSLNASFGVGVLAYFALFAQVFYAEGQPLIILIVATAALNIGALIGFLYSTFGEEEKKFSPIFVALNGLMSGATLTDLLQKDHSFIIKCLKHITQGCGLAEKYTGAVFVVIVTCLPIGFFWLYLNRKLLLNPEAQKVSLAMQRLAEAREVLNDKPLPVITEPDAKKLVVDSSVRAAAEIITKRPDVGESNSVGALINDGHAFYAQGKFDKAIPIFQKALNLRPNQPDTLLYTASAMISEGQFLEAIKILEKLIQFPTAPITAWKLLGYAYLFYPDDLHDKPQKLQQSIQASEKYLDFDAEDAGAQLNLACAYGQLGPEDKKNREQVLGLVRSLLKTHSSFIERIKALTAPGQDFEKWIKVPEFLALLTHQTESMP